MTDYTAQKMKFSIKDFFSKCDQIRRKLRIWSHLLKESLMENFIFCTVLNTPELYERLKIYVSDFSEYILWIEEYISSIVT